MKQKTIQLDPLTARKAEISRMLGAHKSGAARLSDVDRRWLEREQRHYRDEAGDFDTWQEKRSRILAIEASTAATAAEKAQAEAEAEARAAAQFAEIDAKIRAKIAFELDPVTQYKRQHSDRTF